MIEILLFGFQSVINKDVTKKKIKGSNRFYIYVVNMDKEKGTGMEVSPRNRKMEMAYGRLRIAVFAITGAFYFIFHWLWHLTIFMVVLGHNALVACIGIDCAIDLSSVVTRFDTGAAFRGIDSATQKPGIIERLLGFLGICTFFYLILILT